MVCYLLYVPYFIQIRASLSRFTVVVDVINDPFSVMDIPKLL